MKGLLLKDFYMVLKYCRTYILIVVVFTIVGIFGNSNNTFLLYPVIISGMMPQTLLAYDERSRWNTYALIFPYPKKRFVSSKYILTVCLVAATIVISAAAMIVKSFATGVANDSGFSILANVAAIGIAAPSITMPVIFKFGTEKGRYVHLVTVALFVALLTLVSMKSSDSVSLSANIPPKLIILAVSAVLFAVSWLISILIYEKREL